MGDFRPSFLVQQFEGALCGTQCECGRWCEAPGCRCVAGCVWGNENRVNGGPLTRYLELTFRAVEPHPHGVPDSWRTTWLPDVLRLPYFREMRNRDFSPCDVVFSHLIVVFNGGFTHTDGTHAVDAIRSNASGYQACTSVIVSARGPTERSYAWTDRAWVPDAVLL